MPKHCSSIRRSIYNREKVLEECHSDIKNVSKTQEKMPKHSSLFPGSISNSEKV